MTTQIAVKLPDDLSAALDDMVERGVYASRSEAVRAAVAALVRRAAAERIDRAFAQGFNRHPERPEELADATRLAVEAIEDEPWEPWW
jgi:Arc/MetJ-type ribon-helix-helix transcriptional regulator